MTYEEIEELIFQAIQEIDQPWVDEAGADTRRRIIALKIVEEFNRPESVGKIFELVTKATLVHHKAKDFNRTFESDSIVDGLIREIISVFN